MAYLGALGVRSGGTAFEGVERGVVRADGVRAMPGVPIISGPGPGVPTTGIPGSTGLEEGSPAAGVAYGMDGDPAGPGVPDVPGVQVVPETGVPVMAGRTDVPGRAGVPLGAPAPVAD
ncbi:MAG: hypothetical protein ABI592_05660 [Acidobacteriota bacterium]